MESKVSYALVGFFVIVLAAALLGIISWLRGGDRGVEYQRYDVFVQESVSGLSVNAPVKYRGVQVGKVRDIRLRNPEEVQLILDIAEGTPIKQDTVAVLTTQGITGLAFIDLTGGTKESPPLSSGVAREFPVIQSGPSLFMRFDEAITGILNNMNSLTLEIRTLISAENRDKYARILEDLSEITHSLADNSQSWQEGMSHGAKAIEDAAEITRTVNERLPEITEKLAETLENVSSVSKDISDLSKETKARLPELIDRLAATADSIQKMTNEIAGVTRSVGSAVGTSQANVEQFTSRTLSEMGLLVTELRQLTGGLNRLVREIEREPNSVLLGKQPRAPGPGEAK